MTDTPAQSPQNQKDLKGFKLWVAKIKEMVDHAGEADGAENPPWLRQVAMLTGVLAAVSGYLAVRTTTLTNDAIYESNLAILAQTESSDAWNEYQSDSIKARISETALNTAPATLPDMQRNALSEDAKETRDRQPKIKQTAIDKAKERDDHLKDGLKRLAEKDILSYAGLAAQVGIGLASVAALVRMRAAFYVGVTVGVISVIMLVYAFATHYGVAPAMDQLAPEIQQLAP